MPLAHAFSTVTIGIPRQPDARQRALRDARARRTPCRRTRRRPPVDAASAERLARPPPSRARRAAGRAGGRSVVVPTPQIQAFMRVTSRGSPCGRRCRPAARARRPSARARRRRARAAAGRRRGRRRPACRAPSRPPPATCSVVVAQTVPSGPKRAVRQRRRAQRVQRAARSASACPQAEQRAPSEHVALDPRARVGYFSAVMYVQHALNSSRPPKIVSIASRMISGGPRRPRASAGAVELRVAADPAEHGVVVGGQELEPLVDVGDDRLLAERR